MSNQQHLKYRRIPFKPDVPSTLFSLEEIELLRIYGSWFSALMRGDISPETNEQQEFVDAARGLSEPTSEFEMLWVRYLKRKIWEIENPNYIGKEANDLLINLGISNGKWGSYGSFK